jgi:hypothetical protein
MKRSLLGAALVAALALPGSSWAHHAAAGVDQSSTVTVEGTINQVRWANPHSWIEMDVVDSEGVTRTWNLEMQPPSFLVRAGWTRRTIEPGDRVTVVARPMMNGDPGGLFVSITLADGTELTQRAARGGARGGGN